MLILKKLEIYKKVLNMIELKKNKNFFHMIKENIVPFMFQLLIQIKNL